MQGVGGDAVGQLPPSAECEVGGASHMDGSKCADALQKKPCKDVANPEGGASVCSNTEKADSEALHMQPGGVGTLVSSTSLCQTQGRQERVLRKVKAKGELLSMTESDVKGLGGLLFHGIVLDNEFVDQFYGIMPCTFTTMEFIDYVLNGRFDFANILDSCTIKHLSIINYGLTKEDLDKLLLRINPYMLRTLDISSNGFDKSIIEVLRNRIYITFYLDSLILRDERLSGLMEA